MSNYWKAYLKKMKGNNDLNKILRDNVMCYVQMET